MTKTLLASLLLLAACAGSPKKTPPLDGDDMTNPVDRVPATCTQTGATLFEIAHDHAAGDPSTSTLKIYKEGTDHGWSFDDASGAHRTGCLSMRRYGDLDKALHATTWKRERDAVACAAMSNTFVTYKVDGTQVWSDQVCNIEHLDAQSRASLDTAIKLATEAAGIAAPTPS